MTSAVAPNSSWTDQPMTSSRVTSALSGSVPLSGMDDVDGVFYKTTAYMNNGVSGGAALNTAGELINKNKALLILKIN